MLSKKGLMLVMGFLTTVCTAQAGDLEIHPSIAVQEEYTDNVFETSSDRVSDFITRAIPGLSLTYKAPAFEGDLSYLFDYRYYAKNSRKDDTTHTLIADSRLTVIENLLFMDIADNYQRVSLDVTRDVTRESLFADQSDRNVAIISPNLILRPTSQAEARFGYRFTDTRYTGSQVVNNIDIRNITGNLGIDKMEHMGFLNVKYEFSPRWFATFDYDFVRQESELVDFNHHLASGGIRYEYGDQSFLFAKAGNTWINYDNGKRMSNFFWHAGVTQTFPTLVTTLTTGVKYDEDPLSTIIRETYVKGIIDKELSNGKVGGALYYSEFAFADTGILDTKKYGGEIYLFRELSARLSGRVAFTAEKYEQSRISGTSGISRISGNTRRLLGEASLSYLLGERFNVSLSYVYVDYYSREILTDNRHINRGIIEFRKVF